MIFKLPLNNATTAIQGLKQRYMELCARASNLPPVANLRLPSDLDLELVISYLPPTFFSSPPPKNPDEADADTTSYVNRAALTMALFGWQEYNHDRLGSQLGSVSCHSCFRVLGLWLFKTKEGNTVTEELNGPVINCLDVVKEHRQYCPWSNSISQNGTSSAKSATTPALAGWETLIRVLKNDHHLRQSATIRTTIHPVTRQGTADNVESELSVGVDLDDDEARSIREEKDKERWARLRRVKSLFDSKGNKRLQRQAADTK